MTEQKALEILKRCSRVAYQNADGTDESSAELYEALQTVFALINRQQEEIERLNSVNDEKFRQWDMLAEMTKQHYADLYEEARDTLKVEAYKEFAKEVKEEIKKAYNNNSEVLKEHLEKYKDNFNSEFVATVNGKMISLLGLGDFIDNLLKEMTGDE